MPFQLQSPYRGDVTCTEEALATALPIGGSVEALPRPIKFRRYGFKGYVLVFPLQLTKLVIRGQASATFRRCRGV